MGTNLEAEHLGEAEVGVVSVSADHRHLGGAWIILNFVEQVDLAFLKVLVLRQHHRILEPTRKRWQRRSSKFPRVFSGSYESPSIAH